MRLLLDTDILLWQSASSAEKEINWGSDVWSLFTDLKDAKQAFEAVLSKLEERFQPEEIICCLSDPQQNFRRDVDPGYKSNRRGTRKPTGYVALCDWVKDNFITVTKPKLEADDCMGILATKPSNVGQTIIVSSDKDLKSIPGKLYRPMSDEFLDISEAEADRFFLTQALTGDQVDGIAGLKGVGPKTAEKILGNRPTWEAVEQAYIKAGQTKDDALRQARLVRILRWTDWDSEKGEVRLWTPNTSHTKNT